MSDKLAYTGLQSVLRLLAMGSANLNIKGIYLNGRKYSVKLRIPVDVKKHYPEGKTFLQAPLGTSDYLEALKKATPILEQWKRDFKALRAGKRPPEGVLKAHPIRKDLSNVIEDKDSVQDAVDTRFQKEAERRTRDTAKKQGRTLTQQQFLDISHGIYYGNEISFEDVLNPAELNLLAAKGHIHQELRLSDALRIYLLICT